MCNNIILHHDDGSTTEISNQGELLGHASSIHAIALDSDAEYRASDCLCPVRISETASRNGYVSTRLHDDGDYDAFDYHWRKEANNNMKGNSI